MICPECKAEYRQGFTVCADCDVALVDTLPTVTPRAEEFDVVAIWAGDDQPRCVALCLELKDAGIRYHVSQSVTARIGMNVNWRYELGVPAAAAESAKTLLELPDTVVEESSDFPEEDENQALLEYPHGGKSAAGDARIRRNYSSYLNPWYPEDASIEIWTRPADEHSTVVESCLQANCIRAREDVQRDGSKKYFVMPEDADAAREIVRQILEDSPSA
jgi:hypothetical protein